MKKLLCILAVTFCTATVFTACGGGGDKPAADSTTMKKDTPMAAPAAMDTSKMDTAKKRPIPPNN